jgi:hypothetical protein
MSWYRKAQNLANEIPQVAEMTHQLPGGLENYAVALMGNIQVPNYAQGKVLDYIRKIHPIDGNAFRVPKMHNNCRCELVPVGDIPNSNEKIYYWKTNPMACPKCLQMAQVYNQASTEYLEDVYPKKNIGTAPIMKSPIAPPEQKQILPAPTTVKPPETNVKLPEKPVIVPNDILTPQNTEENRFFTRKPRIFRRKNFI